MASTLALNPFFEELYKTTLANPLLFPLLLLLLSLFILLKFTAKSGGKLRLPPAPPKLPLIGHIHLISNLPHHSFRALSDKCGPLMLLQLNRPTLIVTSVDMAKEVMRTQDVIFANRPPTWASELFFYGCSDVGFCPHGEYWKHVRKICISEFWSSKMVQSVSLVREEEVMETVKIVRRACVDRTPFNIAEAAINITVGVIAKSVLGRKYEGGKGKRSFGELSKSAMELFAEFCFRDVNPWLAWLDVVTGLARRMKTTWKEYDEFLDQVIEEYQKSLARDGGHKPADKSCFIERLLRVQKETMLERELTQDNIKALLQDMFIGGTDTVATTMEWAMTELVRHPTIMKKVQEEVRRVVGQKPKIEEGDINQMDYLKCIIKETLRLHPPAPMLNWRESSESTKINGYDIPAKTKVLINAWAIQRDPKLWERPDEFVPERFAENSMANNYNGQDLQYMPFGSGRRVCPGIQFGLTEIDQFLANLLHWFDWELPGGMTVEDLDMSEIFGLVAHKRIPLELIPRLHFA